MRPDNAADVSLAVDLFVSKRKRPVIITARAMRIMVQQTWTGLPVYMNHNNGADPRVTIHPNGLADASMETLKSS
jgi:hypothetical protein